MNSFVYFISDGAGRIKIGYSINPGLRLQSLQTANASQLQLLGAIPGTLRTEQALHEMFANFRLSNEWFRSEPALTDAVQSLISLYDPYAPKPHEPASEREPLRLDEAVLRQRLNAMLRARWPVRTDKTLEKLGIAPARAVRNWLLCLCFPNGVALLNLVNVAGLEFLRELIDEPSPELLRAARSARRERLEAELTELELLDEREAVAKPAQTRA